MKSKKILSSALAIVMVFAVCLTSFSAFAYSSTWSKVKEKNGQIVEYYNSGSNLLVVGDSRTVQMYNLKQKGSFVSCWGGHYGYGSRDGGKNGCYRIDNSESVTQMKKIISKICKVKGSVRVVVEATINDWNGGSGYKAAANSQISVAKTLRKYIKNNKLTGTVYVSSLIGSKNGPSVSNYNSYLKNTVADISGVSYKNIKPDTVKYRSDGVHYTDGTAKDVFAKMNSVK